MDAVGFYPKVSAAAAPNNVQQAQLETLAPASIGEMRTNAPEHIEVSDNTLSEETGKVDSVKVDFTASLVSALDENAGAFLPVRHFSRKNYETVDIVRNLDEIKEVPYPL